MSNIIIKPSEAILASSLDNYIALDNPSYDGLPYIQFVINNITTLGSFTIRDNIDVNSFSLTIDGGEGSVISDTQFNSVASTMAEVTYSLVECLKLNIIFSNISVSDNVVRATIDSSRTYEIVNNSFGSAITISGTYASITNLYDEYILNLNYNNNSFDLRKRALGSIISFNLTSPFSNGTTKDPFDVSLKLYSVSGDKTKITPIAIDRGIYTIMPTTLSRFEKVDYSLFLYDVIDVNNTKKVNFLTNNLTERYYNNNSTIGLSILTNMGYNECSDLKIIGSLYDINNIWVRDVDMTHEVVVTGGNTKRVDFYCKVKEDIRKFDHIVVKCFHNNNNVTNDLKLKITHYEAFNMNNRDLFYINSIGGLDSFTFTNNVSNSTTTNITNNSTYIVNNNLPFTNINQLETVRKKSVNKTYTLISQNLSTYVTEWLNELGKSKYVYLYDVEVDYSKVGSVNKTMIIIDNFNTEVVENNNKYQVTLEYHNSDNILI